MTTFKSSVSNFSFDYLPRLFRFKANRKGGSSLEKNNSFNFIDSFNSNLNNTENDAKQTTTELNEKQKKIKKRPISMQSKFLLTVWFLLTLVFSALNLICFLYPFWFGSSYSFDVVASNSSRPNQTNKFVDFGLYKICFTSTMVSTSVAGESRKKLSDSRKLIASIDYDEGQSIYEETSTVLTMTTNNRTSMSTISSATKPASSSSLFIKTKCFGNWKQHYSILNNYFKIATYLMLIACGFGVLSVVICSLMISIRPKQILYFDSAIQLSIGKLIISFFSHIFALFYSIINSSSSNVSLHHTRCLSRLSARLVRSENKRNMRPKHHQILFGQMQPQMDFSTNHNPVR